MRKVIYLLFGIVLTITSIINMFTISNLNNSCNNTNKNIHMKKGTLTHMISVIMNQCTFCMSTPFGCCFLGVVPV